jgi:histidinol-phosphate aminotransferase
MPAMKSAIDSETRVVWLCSPNNPTGNSFAQEDIEEILRLCPGIVVLDEAYIDFSERPSMLAHLDKYPRLIVLQTLSKAWGQAAIRCGMAFAAPEIIDYFNKVKYPYNVPLPTQQQALRALSDIPAKERAVREILDQRALVAEGLRALPCCSEVFPSDANFLLARFDDANATYGYLVRRGIIVRNRNRVALCSGCLRITVGTPAENALLLEALRQLPM